MPPGAPNGAHKSGLHYRVPPPYGGPQPYAIPTRGAIHGPVGGVSHVPPPGNRGFTGGGGGGGHLPHQQQGLGSGSGSQQAIGSAFNFPSMENPNSQPSPGGPLSQPGYVSNVSILFYYHFALCFFRIFFIYIFFENLVHLVDDSGAKPDIS